MKATAPFSSFQAPQNTYSRNEYAHSDTPQLDLVYQISLAVFSLMALALIYQRVFQNSSSSSMINRINRGGVELTSRKSYKYCQDFCLLLKIKFKQKSWDYIHKYYLRESTSNSKKTIYERAESYAKIRKITKITTPASKTLIKDLFINNKIQGSILELGSNILNKNGNSYLASLLEEKYLKKLTYSDYSPEIVQPECIKTIRKYIQVDARNLSNDLPECSYSNIVGINVIDTISRISFKI